MVSQVIAKIREHSSNEYLTNAFTRICQFKTVTKIAILVQQGLETLKAVTKRMNIFSLPLEARELFAEALSF